MKWINRLWFLILFIIFCWIYFLFINPYLFNRKTIEMPNVIGLEEEIACGELDKLGIKYRLNFIESEEESIIKTLPYAGVEIKKGFVVDLFIGVLVPNCYPGFIGTLYEEKSLEIERLCNDNNLTLNIIYVDRTDVISGVIVDESIKEGNKMSDYEELIITVSTNDDYFVMPNLVGLNIEEVIGILSQYNINPIINYYPSPIEYDIVLYQSIYKDKIIKKGNTYELTLYVSKGVNVDECSGSELEEILVFLGYDVEVYYLKSNFKSDKLVAFEVEKLYHNSELKFILFVTE